MQYEVEQKFPVTNLGETERRLETLGATFGGAAIEQADAYFGHPARDFAATDEAFRIRRVGDKSVATYKGPKIDAETKTRRELEVPLAGGAEIFAQYRELLELLGFRFVAEVSKTRRKGKLDWHGQEVACDLDDVRDVGLFLELEIVCDEATLEENKTRLLELAAELQLGPGERRSYLEMLLKK